MKRWGIALVFGIIGTVFALVGGLLGTFGSRWLNDEAKRIESLPIVSAASFDDRQPGTDVLIEGMVDPRMSTRFRTFVAYVREEYRGKDKDGNEIWHEDERATPALRIALSDGIVRLSNTSYQLYQKLSYWQQPGELTWGYAEGSGTKRYRGIESGAAVLSVGKVVLGSEGLELQAEFVAGGTRAEYLENQRLGATIFSWIGGGLGAFGGLFLLIAVIIVIKVR